MRRTFWFALMISLLLSGCGGARDEEAVLRWQQQLAAESFSFTAEITALGEAETLHFTLLCRCGGGVTEATLTAPELLRGLRFRTEAGSAEILYDGMLLSLGGITREGLSPCALLPLLAEAMTGGRVLLTWREADCLAAELESGEGQSVCVWFGQEMTPLRAEFAEEGRTVLFCEIINWTTEA